MKNSKYIVPLNKTFKIWFSSDENVFLPHLNIIRLIDLRQKNPDLKISLIYSRSLLNDIAFEDLREFSNTFNIGALSIEEIFAQDSQQDKNEIELNELILKELDDWKKDKGGSPGSASDLTRIKKSVLELGIYSDFDLFLNFDKQKNIETNLEFLVNIEAFTDVAPSTRTHHVEFNNNIMSLTYTKEGKVSQQAISALSGLQKTALDNFSKISLGIENAKKLSRNVKLLHNISSKLIEVLLPEETFIQQVMIYIFMDYIKSDFSKNLSWNNFRKFIETRETNELISYPHKINNDLSGRQSSLQQFKTALWAIQKQHINKDTEEEGLNEFALCLKLDLLTISITNLFGPKIITPLINQMEYQAKKDLFKSLQYLVTKGNNDLSYLSFIKTEATTEKINNMATEIGVTSFRIIDEYLKKGNDYIALKYIFPKDNKVSDITDERWYSAEQMEEILNHFSHSNDINTYVPSHNQLGHGVLLENIGLSLEHARNDGIAILPLQVNNNHWVGMTIRYINDIFEIVFLDPFGHSLKHYDQNSIISHFLERATDGGYQIIETTLRQQYNGYDCGPITLDNLQRVLGFMNDNPDQTLTQTTLETQILNSNIQQETSSLRNQHNLILNPIELENENNEDSTDLYHFFNHENLEIQNNNFPAYETTEEPINYIPVDHSTPSTNDGLMLLALLGIVYGCVP